MIERGVKREPNQEPHYTLLYYEDRASRPLAPTFAPESDSYETLPASGVNARMNANGAFHFPESATRTTFAK